jgi:antitoxin (DNA-binding transcriptional repressor) of toxin-antitoxin stability system
VIRGTLRTTQQKHLHPNLLGYHLPMAVIHISEADAVRDFAKVLAYVRAGSEVIIDSNFTPIAVLVPSAEQSGPANSDHDAWFHTMVQQSLDDSRPDTSSDEVESHFAQRRAASLLKVASQAR